MRILALDASGGCWSAAVLEGEDVRTHAGGDSRRATAEMPGVIRDLLAARPFDAVAVGTGPGSFTGLRGALALGHGLALGAGVPVMGVTVAEALRHGGTGGWEGAVWVALDARRAGRLFLDTGDGMVACGTGDLPQAAGPVLVLGDAAVAVAAVMPMARAGLASVSAVDVGRVALQRLAGSLGPCTPQPLYIDPPAARG